MGRRCTAVRWRDGHAILTASPHPDGERELRPSTRNQLIAPTGGGYVCCDCANCRAFRREQQSGSHATSACTMRHHGSPLRPEADRGRPVAEVCPRPRVFWLAVPAAHVQAWMDQPATRLTRERPSRRLAARRAVLVVPRASAEVEITVEEDAVRIPMGLGGQAVLQ